MRFIIFWGIGILVWAGSISIYYPKAPTKATASPVLSCSKHSGGNDLLNHLKGGTLTSIKDNGRILTITLAPTWKDLSSTTRQKAYQAIACYAKAQHRSFRLFDSDIADFY